MKRVLHLLCVVLVGVLLAACSSGGGSDSDSTATENPTTEATGFTAEMLDANPTLYFVDELGTNQSIYSITGSNATYTLEVSDYVFDSQGNLIDFVQEQFQAVLQTDGTLEVILPDSSVAVLELSEVSPGEYWVVIGPDDVGTWEEAWYYSKPANWVEAATPTEGFTAELLDANPTLYFAETVDEGIDQTIITITGSNGAYTLDVSEYEFYDQGNLTASWTGQFPAQLQEDGTLLVTTPEGSLVLDLLQVRPSEYWVVAGEDEFGIWEEYWYYSKPPNWIEIG